MVPPGCSNLDNSAYGCDRAACCCNLGACESNLVKSNWQLAGNNSSSSDEDTIRRISRHSVPYGSADVCRAVCPLAASDKPHARAYDDDAVRATVNHCPHTS